MAASLARQVVVESQPGAGGDIATQGVVAATAHGYTLLVHRVACALHPSLFANAGCNASADLQQVGGGCRHARHLICVPPDVKASMRPSYWAWPSPAR